MSKIKKTLGVCIAAAALLSLNGCGSSSNDYPGDLTTLFLVDDLGYSYAGIPYKCDSMDYWVRTPANGEFSFFPGENCVFDLGGLNGTDPNDGYVDQLIYIVDYRDSGKNGIPYECELFNAGFINETYDDGIWSGSFDYDADDRCVFYF